MRFCNGDKVCKVFLTPTNAGMLYMMWNELHVAIYAKEINERMLELKSDQDELRKLQTLVG